MAMNYYACVDVKSGIDSFFLENGRKAVRLRCERRRDTKRFPPRIESIKQRTWLSEYDLYSEVEGRLKSGVVRNIE
jgi:hypothetical protein